MKKLWFGETLFEDVATRYAIRSSLHKEKTPFQNMKLVESERFGKMLVLDGAVQTTEKDEFIYHEMMVHVPMFAHPKPQNILVIGGGDGGILRETLKHKTMKKVTLVEIDKRVIDFSIRHLPSICGNSFNDKRVSIVIEDGALFVKKTKEKYDVVIVDSPDPVGPATVLFTKQFYENLRASLTPNGIMVRQCGSSFLQPEELRENFRIVKKLFKYNAPFVFAVPTYWGGFFTATFSSQKIDPLRSNERSIVKRFGSLKLKTGYYNPELHGAAFKVPQYLKELVTWQKR